MAPADTTVPVCRGGVRVENAREGRRGARFVNGYAEDMQLFNGPLPLPPPAFDLPPQVINHIWVCCCFFKLAICSSKVVRLFEMPRRTVCS